MFNWIRNCNDGDEPVQLEATLRNFVDQILIFAAIFLPILLKAP